MSQKDIPVIKLYKLQPLVVVLIEVSRIPIAYRLTHKKIVLLMPLHYFFKRIAWIMGFISR